MLSKLLTFLLLGINAIKCFEKKTFSNIMNNNERIRFDYYVLNETNYEETNITKYIPLKLVIMY